jgi:hypothetical protein
MAGEIQISQQIHTRARLHLSLVRTKFRTRRTADHAQHVGGRCLLLQRLTQLVEQPRVLDGDDGLCGEIPEQLDLSVGERQHFLPIDSNAADQIAFIEHRDKDVGACARCLDERNKARFAIDVSRLDHKIGDGNNACGLSQPRKRVTRIFAYPKNRIFGPALSVSRRSVPLGGKTKCMFMLSLEKQVGKSATADACGVF